MNGGARSRLWRQILCDALGVDLLYVPDHRGRAGGCAILAGIGSGRAARGRDGQALAGRVLRHATEAGAHGAATAEHLAASERIRGCYPALGEMA